jgi:cell division protein FtsB
MNRRSNRKKSKSNPKLVMIIAAVLFVVYMSIITFGSHGLITLVEKESIKGDLEDQLSADSLELKELRKQKKLLETDDATIEKVARESYNLQKDGETIYKIERVDSVAN